jgi:hypothetical protein
MPYRSCEQQLSPPAEARRKPPLMLAYRRGGWEAKINQ